MSAFETAKLVLRFLDGMTENERCIKLAWVLEDVWRQAIESCLPQSPASPSPVPREEGKE